MKKKFKDSVFLMPIPFSCIETTFLEYLSIKATGYLLGTVVFDTNTSTNPSPLSKLKITSASRLINMPIAPTARQAQHIATESDQIRMNIIQVKWYLKEMAAVNEEDLIDFFFTDNKIRGLDFKGHFHKRRFAILANPQKYIPIALLDDNQDIRHFAQLVYQALHLG
jgi:hypothetical protein